MDRTSRRGVRPRGFGHTARRFGLDRQPPGAGAHCILRYHRAGFRELGFETAGPEKGLLGSESSPLEAIRELG